MKKVYLESLITALLLTLTVGSFAQSSVSFSSSNLSGAAINNPTSLQFGPDGRLYVSRQNGIILALTVQKNGKNDYEVVSTETITLIRDIPNHDDNGVLNPTVNTRQITGILVKGTSTNPVIYVGSSDPRIGGGGTGGDKNLDTNSGIISKLTWNGSTWVKVDLVIGLPRSEENHSVNGMQLDEVNNILYVAVGGHTNAGAPSNNFAFLCEFALSAAILAIDLNMIEDQFAGSYVLPTLDDPTRSNTGPGGSDENDPYGGNDGLNQARLVVGGPVQIYSPGYRNAFDLVITKTPGKEGRMYTVDNGANGGWGGHPDQEGAFGNPLTTNVTNNYVPGEPGSTGPGPNDAVVNNRDGLHLVSKPGMNPIYAGHPNPIRANPAGAGWYWYDNDAGIAHFELSPTVDWPPVPLSLANPVEGDYRNPGVDDGALFTWNSSTNGLAEYTSDKFFNGSMVGDLITASFNGNIYRIKLTEDGTAVQFVESIASGFGSVPLDVIAQGIGEVYEGTIWVANYGSNNITIFEPEGSWEPVTTVDNSTPIARHENSFVELGGKFYLLGGRETTIMNIYDPAVNIWTTGANLPFVMHHFQAVTWNGKIYVLGAYQGTFSSGNVNNSESPVDKIHIYDPATNTWTEGATIPRPRGSAGVVVYNDEFYLISGIVNGHQDGWVNWVDKYDPVSNTWEVLANAPRERDHFSAVLLGDKIYLTGGRKTNAAGNVFGVTIPEVDVYDIATNTWSTLDVSANLITQRAGTSSVVLNNEIYLIGGESVSQTISHKNCEIFNPDQATWRVGPALITGRHGTAAIVYNNSVYTVAGSANRGGGPVLSSMEVLLSASTCSGDVLNQVLDDDGDCYSNYDETLNGTNPCSASSKPADFDGDCISDLLDDDDDNDGIPDTEDAFAWDPFNGMNTTIPLFYPLLNGDPGFGFYGLGFTGLMTNKVDDYLDLYDPENPNLIMGGAVGIATVPANAGEASNNDQEYAFQFGFKIDPADGIFSINSKLQGTPFFNGIPLNELEDQTQGIYIGNGDQDNYLKFVLAANAGNPGVQVYGENAGVEFISQTLPVTDIMTSGILYLNFVVDPVGGNVQLYYQTGDDVDKIAFGTPIVLPSAFDQILAGNAAMAVGIIASSGSGQAFSASWDFINITSSGPFVRENAPPYYNRYTGNPTAPFVLDLNSIFNDDGGVENLTYEVVSIEDVSFISGHTLVDNILTINFSGSEAGSASVVLKATDEDGLFVEHQFLIQVIPQPTPILRINAGGNAYGSWSADTYFTGGNLFSEIVPIDNTTDDILYQTERWANTFTYQIPVPQNGYYRVNLHFAEVYHGISNSLGVGARVFNVAAEGNPVLTNYDIFQEAGGPAKAIIEPIDSVLVSDGILTLQFTTVTDNAKISAIEIADYILTPIPNASPIVEVPGDRHIYKDQPFSLQIVASDFNFGDVLGYSATGLPETLTIDPETGLISGTVTANEDSYEVTVSVSDGNGGETEVKFFIHVILPNDYSLRINAGGIQQTYGAEVWTADQFYGPSTTFTNAVEIANSDKDELYQSERIANSLTYEIPMPGPGFYNITLHFAEIFWSEPGRRTFNIDVENGQGIRSNYDIFQEAGGANLAVTEDFLVSVTDGFLSIVFTSTIDMAKVSAIEISACQEPVISSISVSAPEICPGGSATLTVNGDLGQAANWHLYSGSCGGTLIESNDTGVFVVNPVGTTTYFVRGEGGCSFAGACTSVIVTVKTVDTGIVVGGTTLTANAAGATYQWIDCSDDSDIPGATNQVFTPATDGSYALRITQDGCTDVSPCVDFVICVDPVVDSFTASETSICTGEMVTLTVMGSLGGSTAWHLYSGTCGGTFVASNVTGVFEINPTVTTTYFVRGEGGCVTGAACSSVEVTIKAVNTAVTLDDLTLTAAATGATYQWINCDGNTDIDGATDNTFTPDANGNYAVRVTQDGCTAVSACFEVIVVGLGEDLSSMISVYPNPSQSNVKIELPVFSTHVTVDLTDVRGRTVLQESRSDTNEVNLDIESLDKGVYIIQITTEKLMKTVKLIVN
jgi:N-acetylneuraminic acid mutarotase